MSVFDRKRLPPETFKLDVERMRRGWYSDKYFANIVTLLTQLARHGYRYEGSARALARLGLDAVSVDVGNIEVEMQWFPRRKPFCIVAGIDKALAILKECAGYFDEDGRFVNTFDQMEVDAVHDGFVAPYAGDPSQVTPVLRVRGRYRDFALLETPTLGALTRGSRIATNVYEVLEAARGKAVMFFPARFDAHEVQAADGYAYCIAVEVFNRRNGHQLRAMVSTDAQGGWWEGAGGGTIAHAAIACFLGDTAEMMLAFASVMPPEVPRVALVDFNNDCVGDSLRVMAALFARWMQLTDEGRLEEAQRFKLAAVRPDTGANLRDVSVPPLGDRRLDAGVNARLVFTLREAIDNAWQAWNLPRKWHSWAQKWCRDVRIIVTGGFKPEKIREFEELGVPVDIYGVGSYLLSSCDIHGTNNDYTADVVRVKVDGKWYDMAKAGRAPGVNPALEPVSAAARERAERMAE
ncbi:MAG: nicotinate phosphoribosyltransferase [Armatimonadetes bacterium]|nr:nicotinate phosphoribosyltransferase [Armatimonadota bacterium]